MQTHNIFILLYDLLSICKYRFMTMNIHEQLYQFIKKKDLGNVRHIMSSTNVNVKKSDNKRQGSTLLHYATTAELCKELIIHGANVNARDSEGRTPLHHAILFRRGLEVVKELLRCGACVNACDNYKCTPLIIAIQLLGKDILLIVRELLKYGANPNVHDYQGYPVLTLAIYKRDLNLIKEMLEWGADINFRNKAPIHCFLMFLTPMTEAVNSDEDCAKLLIKMTVLKYFDNNYKKMINLNRFSRVKNFVKLSSFLDECTCEVLQMKSFIINNKYSLFEYVANSRKCFKPLYWDDYASLEIPSIYPIYHDVILMNLQPHIIRAQLLGKLRSLLLHGSTFMNGCTGNVVYLNADCSCKIAEYLSNDELAALIEAYDKF